MSRIKLVVLLILITGVLCAQEAYEGYTLYSPNMSHNTYLLDMEGDTIHTWNSSNSGGYSTYLLEDGILLRPVSAPNTAMQGGASSGRFEKLDWDGDTVWQFDYHGTNYLPHHDIEPMPNGNILLISWEIKTGAESLANGRSSAITLWPDYLAEIEPSGTNGGEVVWEWHFWDHLIQDHDPTKLNYGVVEDHPELLDINLGGVQGGPGGGGDWLHINGIDYNAELDQIVISSHNLDEIYVIDHSTTTEEAESHTGGNSGMGGDILYRWGNPDNYGANGSYTFDVVHCAYWVPPDCPGAGNLMAFNNSDNDHQSKVVEIEPPYENTYNYSWTAGTSFAPDQPVWQYTNGTGFYSNHLGSVQRLPNGNTLICESTSGDMFEVDESGAIQWSKNTTYEIARCLRYGTDYPGLAALFPNGEITGTVTDTNTSIPIANALITIGEYEVESDEEGSFSIELPAGTYQLTCECEGYELYEYIDDIELTANQVVVLTIELTPVSAINEDEIDSIVLLGNYPNPFNPTTTISFVINNSGVNTELSIYNLKGQKVITLVYEQLPAGQKNVVWEGKDKYGNTVPSGIYLYKLTNGDHISTRKMILMK